MYLGEDVIFDVVGVMLDKEAQQLEDKAKNLKIQVKVSKKNGIFSNEQRYFFMFDARQGEEGHLYSAAVRLLRRPGASV